jgi:drug/metabolite transporter (DMT)-like permease
MRKARKGHGRAAAGGSILLATLWILGAALGWTSMAVVVRYLEGRVPSWDVSFYRALAALLVGIGPMLWQKGRNLAALLPKRELFGAYLARGLVIFTAQAMYYHALMYMPLADATVLNATAPIFSVFLAVLMLRERVGMDRWMLVFLGFAGVVVIVRPGYERVPLEAVLALASAALFALSSILNKRLVLVESGTSIVYGTNFFVALSGLVVVAFWGVRPSWADLGVVALIGVAGAAAQYCLTQALRHGDVSYVSPFEFVRVPLVALAAWLLFAQVPPLVFGLGAAMIFASVLLLARRAARGRPVAPPPAAD